MTLNPIWKTDSKLTGIASRRIFPGSPCGLTSCSEGSEDGRSRVGMAKEGFLTERPILGAAGLQFIRRIPLIWTSYRPQRAQGYSRLQTSGLLSFSESGLPCGTTRSYYRLFQRRFAGQGALHCRRVFRGLRGPSGGRSLLQGFYQALCARLAGKGMLMLRLLVERLAIF
jgi:hypothetical protein